MIVAITGGTGFIGEKLVERHCALGDQVRVLSRRELSRVPFGNAVELFLGDLAVDDCDLRGFVQGANILYHCAGEIRDPARMRAVHLDGTARLIDAANGRIDRWVQLSSVGAYGPHRQGVVTEDTPLHPVTTYEETKTAADNLVANAARAGAFVVSMLRPSSVFGPTMRSRGLAELIDLIDRGLYFYIGKPGALMNLVFVDNVVEALYRCGTMQAAAGRTFIVADSNPLEACVNTIATALGKPAPHWRVPERPARWTARLFGRVPGMPLTEARIDSLVTAVRYSNARIERELGYCHIVSMEEGLKELVAAWRARQ